MKLEILLNYTKLSLPNIFGSILKFNGSRCIFYILLLHRSMRYVSAFVIKYQKLFHFKQIKYFKILSSSPKWESITIYVSVMSVESASTKNGI